MLLETLNSEENTMPKIPDGLTPLEQIVYLYKSLEKSQQRILILAFIFPVVLLVGVLFWAGSWAS